MKKRLLFLLIVGLLLTACAPGNTPDPTATPESTPAPAPTQADYVRCMWHGEELLESALRSRLASAGWTDLVDVVTQDVPGYGPVSRLIVGPTAIEEYEAIAKEFEATPWFVYGIVGSGLETGYRTPQPNLNLLRIEFYEVDNFLPEDPTDRLAPG